MVASVKAPKTTSVAVKTVNKSTHTSKAWDYYIGRPSVLGNPYSERIHGRDLCIQMFEREFLDCLYRGIDTNNFKYVEVIKELETLEAIYLKYKKLNLVCYCTPKPCHGDVIINYLHQMDVL